MLGALAAGILALGCGNDEKTAHLDPIVLGMTSELAPVYVDEVDDIAIYEVKLPVQFPLVAPTRGERRALAQDDIPPYPRAPWVLQDDIEVQVTWTLSNLDAEGHNVHLLLDPWNEFGRYWPGMSVDSLNRPYQNLSGIQHYFELPGTDSDRPSRRSGTITVDDMEELAVDLSTVMSIIQNVPPVDPDSTEEQIDPLSLVNHAFHPGNLSDHDPLVQQYVPDIVADLTGFDLGLRTNEPANVAVEIVVELVDTGKGRVAAEDDYSCLNGDCTWRGDDEHDLIRQPTEFITLAGPGYGP